MPPISFLAPMFLVGAAAAAIPVVLHLFARETATTVAFSAVRLVEATPVEHARRSRLTDLLLLALRMAVLALLALAFARPFLATAAEDERLPLTIVALDGSASMSAPGTWRAARAGAQSAIAAAPPGGLVALAVFSDDARTVVEPTTDRAALGSALNALSPGFGPTRLGAVFDLARGLANGRPAELVVLSDFPSSIATEPAELWLEDPIKLRLEAAPPPANDLRVVTLRRTEGGVAALVEAEGSGRVDAVVSLTLDGREQSRQVVAVEGGSRAEVLFAVDLPASGVLSASVDDPGGRPAGDERFMVLDRRPPIPVLLIESAGAGQDAALYVRAALDADPLRTFAPDVRRADDPMMRAAEWTSTTRAVVLLGARGMDRQGRATLARFVEGGGGLFIAAGALPDVSSLLEPMTTRVSVGAMRDLAPADSRLVVGSASHPLLAAFGDRAASFGEVRLARAAALAARGDGVVLHLSSGEAALVQGHVGAGRVLAFASDLSGVWNDFPKHAAFVPFITEAVRFVAAAARPAETMEVSGGASGRRPGSASVGEPPWRVAVNVPAEEFGQSTLDPAAIDQLVARRPVDAPAAADVRGAEGRLPLWRMALLTALVLFIVEGLVAAARGPASVGVRS